MWTFTLLARLSFTVVVVSRIVMSNRIESSFADEDDSALSLPPVSANAPAKKAAKKAPPAPKTSPDCKTRYAVIKRINPNDPKTRTMAMNQSGYKCDGWMIAFVREIPNMIQAFEVLDASNLRIQLWSWTIRPHRDPNGFAHNAKIHHRRGMIGFDTHFFTLVDLDCYDERGRGRFWVFDTISENGRDVTGEDWGVSKDLLRKDFTFEASFNVSEWKARQKTLEQIPTQECGFENEAPVEDLDQPTTQAAFGESEAPMYQLPECVIEYATPWKPGKGFNSRVFGGRAEQIKNKAMKAVIIGKY